MYIGKSQSGRLPTVGGKYHMVWIEGAEDDFLGCDKGLGFQYTVDRGLVSSQEPHTENFKFV
jgi:hypothetical protein